MTKWHLVFLHAVAEFCASQHRGVVFFWLFVNILLSFSVSHWYDVWNPWLIHLSAYLLLLMPKLGALCQCELLFFSTIKLCRRATVTWEHLRPRGEGSCRYPRDRTLYRSCHHKTGPQSCSSPRLTKTAWTIQNCSFDIICTGIWSCSVSKAAAGFIVWRLCAKHTQVH